MSYAKVATEALHDVAIDAYAPCRAAGLQLHAAYKDARAELDLVRTMGRTIELLLAMERLHDETDAAIRKLRTVLTQQMSDTGASTIQTAHHTAYLARKPAWVSISDEGAIPPDYVVQKPSIDKAAIKSALAAGVDVPGCTLIQPNEQSLNLRARKDAP